MKKQFETDEILILQNNRYVKICLQIEVVLQ